MYSIDQFSLITQLTKKALYYYHNLGILKASTIDSESGTLRYSRDQILLAGKIKYYRLCEIPISEIAHILSLEEEGEYASFISLHGVHESHVEKRVVNFIEALKRIESLKIAIDAASRGKIDFVTVPAMNCMVCRKIGPTSAITGMIYRLKSYASQNKIAVKGLPIFIRHDDDFRELDCHIEVALPVQHIHEDTDDIFFSVKQGGNMMRFLLKGFSNDAGPYYERLFSLINTHNVGVTGFIREVFHKISRETKTTDLLTEILVPVDSSHALELL